MSTLPFTPDLSVKPEVTAFFDEPTNTTDLLDAAGRAAKDFGVAESGDKIGITAGLPSLRSGGTNLFKVHTVE